ncbi:hypothetical protein BDW75DRAFT_230454 [Aspergillus navahoensis]
MPEPTSFTFNIAYSVPINKDPSQPTLTLEEFWHGLRRGGEKPHLFAEYVADTEILPNRKSENEFQRKLIMANGAVRTAKGVELLQDVRNADKLLDDGPDALYLTAIYELHVPDVEPGSDRAKEIERDYSNLAQSAARTVVETIRRWKVEGGLEA